MGSTRNPYWSWSSATSPPIFALDLADEKEAEAILTYCEEYLDQE
jgi:hypothetical protein